MSFRLPFPVLACLLMIAPAAFAKEEILVLAPDHRATIAVPEGFIFSSGKDEVGTVIARITDRERNIDLQLSLVPDPQSRLVLADGRREFLAKASLPYAEGSVEHSFDFIELEPRTGWGTYLVFTDASLVGKLPAPPGEYLNVTFGILVQSGYFATFTLLSQNTTSPEYATAMKLLKTGISEPPSGPKI